MRLISLIFIALIHDNINVARCQDLIKVKRIRVHAFLSLFISCAVKRELLVGKRCDTAKRNGFIKSEMASEIIRADVLSEAEETRAEETATSAHSMHSVNRHFESPPFTHLYTIHNVYAPRIMHRILSVEHQWWSCSRKKNNRFVWRNNSCAATLKYEKDKLQYIRNTSS